MLMALERLRSEWRFELIEIDIDNDRQLRETYKNRVPLLNDDQGRCLSEFFLDQETLLSYLRGA
jgi:glutathione S-transferase